MIPRPRGLGRRRQGDPAAALSALVDATPYPGDAMVDVGTAPLLSCRGVDVAYDKVQVLFGVDIDVAPGEIVALLGTNGAGMSTLL